MKSPLNKKNNLLVALLGGTIGSGKNPEGIVTLSGDPAGADLFDSIDKRFCYKVISPVRYSSENADAATYKQAILGILEEAKRPGTKYKGILILHGTDSMAFFAQVAVRTLSQLKIPVMITGSKRPADEDKSDALKNVTLALGILHAAVKDGTGARTFGVVYEDSYTGKAVYMDAKDAETADINGDMRSFVDRSGKEYIKFSKKGKSPFASEEYMKKTESFIKREEGKILVIPAVPGAYIPGDPDGFKAVLIECYHSGTADDKNLISLVRKAKEAGIPVLMGPAPEDGNIYTSRKVLEQEGAMVISGMPFEGIWAEAVIDNA